MKLPGDVLFLLEKLAPHETYLVGGCVRDFLTGREIHDYDLATSALPAEIECAFGGLRLVETGLKHGTVTVVLHGVPYEITTFRTEGSYSDGRRPDTVCFTDKIEEDLSRRDFTVNAMAYHPKRGLVDPFGGEKDAKAGILRAVGDPYLRFEEDALRILRGVRFASRLSFAVEERTASAMRDLAYRLNLISSERLYQELCGFLMGEDVVRTGLAFSDVLFAFLPELKPMEGFAQRNCHHLYDVWEHTLRAIQSAPRDLAVRLALLFHDSGKPNTFSIRNGEGHFYGHAKESASLAEEALRRLKADNKTRERAVLLIAYHDYPVVLEEKAVSRLVRKIGKEGFLQLIALKKADSSALHPAFVEERIRSIDEWKGIFLAMEARQVPFSLKDLKIDGNDLIALGFSGREIGEGLEGILSAVVDRKLPNEREALLEFAMNLRKGENRT